MAKNTSYRKWSPGLPTADGIFLIARRSGNIPSAPILARAVSAGPRTLLLDLETGEDMNLGSEDGLFSYPLPKITQKAS